MQLLGKFGIDFACLVILFTRYLFPSDPVYVRSWFSVLVPSFLPPSWKAFKKHNFYPRITVIVPLFGDSSSML